MADLRIITAPPPLRLRDVFEKGRWSRVIFLTYSFDLPFFESYMLPLLVRNGAKSITVAADATWLSLRLPTWLTNNDVREAGRSYTLSGVRTGGAFHAKLMLATNESTGAVLVGSGNISTFGMTTGGELFALHEWVGDSLPAIAQQAWALCRTIARTLPVETLFGEQVEAMGRFVPKLTLPPLNDDLLHNLDEPLLDQFVRRIGNRTVKEILLWAPFSDRRLDALNAIVRRLQPNSVTIALQPGQTAIDGERLSEIAASYDNVQWSFVELVQQNAGRTSDDLIHAKGLLVQCASGEDWLLAGSPNLSTPALLQTARTGNCEVALCLRGHNLQESLFSTDGPISLGASVHPGSVQWASERGTTEQLESLSVDLLGARWDGQRIVLNIQGNCPLSAQVIVNNQYTLPVTTTESQRVVLGMIDVVPRSITLVWDGGQSGPVIVADIPRLQSAMSRTESAKNTPLEVLDYGGDNDLIKLLDDLARLAIVSKHDAARWLYGKPPVTEKEEAEEIEGKTQAIHLSDIDFSAVRQHPRASAYVRGSVSSLDTPRLQLWLDEVVRQFETLRQEQLRLVNTPIPTDDDDVSEMPNIRVERQRWTVSRRIRVRIRNRVRRYVDGLGDPDFWRLVSPDWMGQNYILFLDFLNRLWSRTTDSATIILPVDDLAKLTLDLLSRFWGSDEERGYWTTLTETETIELGLLLLEHNSDALTLAMAQRILNGPDEIKHIAPFIVAGVVRALQPLGLITIDTAERALVYLGHPEEDPRPILQIVTATVEVFKWWRYCDTLMHRYRLRDAKLGSGLFVGGDSLVIKDTIALEKHPRSLTIFADFIEQMKSREPGRNLFHMVWNTNDTVLIYDAQASELIWRYKDADGRRNTRTLTKGVEPITFANKTWDQLGELNHLASSRVA